MKTDDPPGSSVFYQPREDHGSGSAGLSLNSSFWWIEDVGLSSEPDRITCQEPQYGEIRFALLGGILYHIGYEDVVTAYPLCELVSHQPGT